MTEMTPRRTVQELDRYIVGQDAAKQAVAVAIPESLAEAGSCRLSCWDG